MSLDTKIEEKLATILSGSIWADSLCNFNDPFECVIHVDKHNESYLGEIKSSANHRGIFCLCATELDSFEFMSNESTLFWAYYGNSNKGICMEYDLEIIKKNKVESDLKEIGEVTYSDSPLSIDTIFNDRDKDEDRREIIFNKHSCWKHEKEVRLIYNNPGRKKIPASALRAIYCGCRISRDNLLLAKCLSVKLGVPCFVLEDNATDFNFTILSVGFDDVFKQVYPSNDSKNSNRNEGMPIVQNI